MDDKNNSQKTVAVAATSLLLGVALGAAPGLLSKQAPKADPTQGPVSRVDHIVVVDLDGKTSTVKHADLLKLNWSRVTKDSKGLPEFKAYDAQGNEINLQERK